jgi:putative phage-type endonuclease
VSARRHTFQTKEEWLEFRLPMITATDAAAICGADKYRSRYTLYHEKLGLVPRSEMREAALWGTVLELPIRVETAKRTGMKITGYAPWTTFVSDNIEWMAATPDGAVVPLGIYEGKTCSMMLKGDWASGPPLKYMFQIQHLMEVMDREWTLIACLVGGQELVHYRIERDREFGKNLINEEMAFKGLLMNRTPPAVDGSDSTAACLALLFNKPEPTKVDLPDHFLSLYRARCDALATAKAKMDTVGEVDNAIKAFMQNNTEAYLPSGEKFTWRMDKKGTRRFRAPSDD